MENGQSKRRVRPAQSLYVPPAQRCAKNSIAQDFKETTLQTDTDANIRLQQRLDTLTISDNDLKPSKSNFNVDEKHVTDSENEEMKRVMVNMNRKSSRSIIKHTTNYLPTNDILQITERITDKANHISNANLNKQISKWEDLIKKDDEGNENKQNDCCVSSLDNNIDEAEEASPNNWRYNHNLSDLDHVIELYDFPASFRTQDLITLYNLVNSDSSYIKWCDETHALLVVGTSSQALRALEIKHDIVKSRPLTLASSIAKQTIEKCDLRPAMKRPQTSMHTARRMITSALGTKSNISAERQQMEREALKIAKEMKRTQRQNEQDAWEGNPRPSTA